MQRAYALTDVSWFDWPPMQTIRRLRHRDEIQHDLGRFSGFARCRQPHNLFLKLCDGSRSFLVIAIPIAIALINWIIRPQMPSSDELLLNLPHSEAAIAQLQRNGVLVTFR